MKLVIDCFKQVKGVGKSNGIYNVALILVQNLVIEKQESFDDEKRNCEIIVLGNKYNREDFDINGVTFIEIRKYNPLNKFHCVIWELLAVSKECKRIGASKVLFPRGYCALTHPIEDIVLIHDLIPFYYDKHFHGYFNKYENAYIMNRLRSSAKSAKKIITISEASKKDIIEYCKVDEKKIAVIHNACNAVKYMPQTTTYDKPYLCGIASTLPHKNAKGILKSYEEYRKVSSLPLDLHIVGVDENYKANISEETKKHVHFHKYIRDDQEVYRLISNAEVFLFLSLIEGFGLPPIEAMQLGVPVICSNLSSLPEVIGDAALLVDPTNYIRVGEEINKLLENKKLKNELIEKGRENVKRFSWETRAKQYWDVILKQTNNVY